MNSLLGRTLLVTLAVLAVFSGILGGFMLLGYRASARDWERDKQAGLVAVARQALELSAAGEAMDISVPDHTPFFVYDAERRLIYSNRGAGRRRQDPAGREPVTALLPVRRDGTLLGYYFAGPVQFRNDEANNRFFESMRVVLGVALGCSFLLSFLFALIFSRGPARQARAVAGALDRLAHGRRAGRRPEAGSRERALIARSANRWAGQLAREQELRRQWAQDVAHDLRTPVSALKAQLEGMRDGVLSTDGRRLERIIRELERVDTLVRDLEELTRLESPEMRLLAEPLAADGLLAELADRFAPALKSKKIDLRRRIDCPRLLADEDLLLRALSNILSNAVRHTPAGGCIRLAVWAEDEDGCIRIFNSGPPITAEEAARAFDRLFRGEYARHSPGSGLGLTIARKIVELHGGTLSIGPDREAGCGTEAGAGEDGAAGGATAGTRVEIRLPARALRKA
jgi:two-component system sensor histidine kinase BaeS